MLSPHLIQTRDGQCIGVVRHPPDQRPSASRHDVVWLVRIPTPKQRAERALEISRLRTEAADWIVSIGDTPESDLPPVAGYGPEDRKHGGAHKTHPLRAAARRKRAALLRAMRQQLGMGVLRRIASQQQINSALRRWPRLHAYYRSEHAPGAYRLPKRPPAPNHIRAKLERALAEAQRHPHDPFFCGRAALAREVLALFEDRERQNDAEATDNPDPGYAF